MDASARKFDILCAGLVVADFVGAPIPAIPDSGRLTKTSRIEMAIGGCAANTAIDLSKLDARVGIVGLVGADAMGQFSRAALEREHVSCDYLGVSETTQTSATLIVNVLGEDRRFIHAVGANAEFTGETLTADVLQQCRILCVGGFALNPKLSGENVRQAFQAARKLGVTTALDVVIGDPAPAWDMLQEVLPETDLFLPNQDEGRLILGLDDPSEQARRFHAAGAKSVIITRGGEGSIFYNGHEMYEAAAFPVEQVDGTGGGDAFVAGYLYGLLKQAAPVECLAYGAAMGASCVRAAGATTSVFRRDELEEYVQAHALKYRRV
ncbi:MAG: carbohydrate kinase family protein [Planctomycetota bacterium]|nr:MAG: carbohydrate kinase family protein [Planctomycetota bacterium]